MDKAIKLGIITLGCPKNTADTEALISKLKDKVSFVNTDEAEIILLNTCAFLKTARDEAYEKIRSLDGKKIVLSGCMAGLLEKDGFKKFPQLFSIVSGAHYPDIADIILSVAKGQKVYAVTPDPVKYIEMDGKLAITPPSYAYIKIAEGCNNACSFCLIPKLKGVYRSRPMRSIVREAKNLIKSGFKEIVLVAQDCGYYGIDLYGEKMLPELLEKISSIKGDFWIRVLYVYPERIDSRLLKTMSESPKICHYLDIPLQHGDPNILKAMHRPYDIKKTLLKINNIKDLIPDITIRTSLIVGFPGETQKAFNKLLEFISEARIDHVGVFEYSREKGTKAYGLKGQIAKKIKSRRRRTAMLTQQKISFMKNKAFVGRSEKTLIERFDDVKKAYIGRSARFAPEIDGCIIVKTKKPLKINKFYNVNIKKADAYDIYGEI